MQEKITTDPTLRFVDDNEEIIESEENLEFFKTIVIEGELLHNNPDYSTEKYLALMTDYILTKVPKKVDLPWESAHEFLILTLEHLATVRTNDEV